MLHSDLQEKAWSLTATLDHPDHHTRTEQLLIRSITPLQGATPPAHKYPGNSFPTRGYKH